MGPPDLLRKVRGSQTKTSKPSKDPARNVTDGRIGTGSAKQKEKKREKKHAQYREHILRSRSIRLLEFLRHDATQVVRDAIGTFHSGIWTAKQSQAIEQFNQAFIG